MLKLLAVILALLGSSLAAAQSSTPQTGFWWNPSDPGSGFVVEVQGNTLLFAAFTYDATGDATWLVSTGPMSTTTQYSGYFVEYTGGQTLTGNYQPALLGPAAGPIAIEFSAPWSALVTLNSGTYAIQRYQFAPNGLNVPPAAGESQTGWWWNPAEPGRGYAIEIQNGQIYLAGYMYDNLGNPLWYLANGDVAAASSFIGFWAQYANGQLLGGPYKAPTLLNADVGSVTLQFSTACSMTMTLPNGRQIPVSRFSFASPAVDLGCNVFPVGLAMANLAANGFQVNETFSGFYAGIQVSGSGTETSDLPYSSAFANQTAWAVPMISTGTMSLAGSPESINATAWQYFGASYMPLGEIDSSGELYVNSGFPGWPIAARVGDSGPLGSVTVYSNQSMSTVTGTQQLGYSVSASPDGSPDSALLTLTTLETDVSPARTSTETDRYLITQSGSVTYLSAELKIDGTTDVLSTVTSFAPLVQPSAMATGAMMVMGPAQRRAAAASLRALPTPRLLRLLHRQIKQASH